MRKSAFLLLIFVFSVVVSPPQAAIAQEGRDVLRWLEEIGRKADLGISAKNVSQTGDATTVGSIDIRVTESIGFKITNARFEDFQPDPTGNVAAATVTIGKISSVGSSAWSMVFAGISGKQISFTTPKEWPVLLNEKFKQFNAVAGVLLNLGAARLDIAEVEIDLPAFMNQAQKTTYQDVRLRNYRNGKIETFSVASVDQTVTQDKLNVASQSEGYENSGINLAALANVISPSAYSNGKGNRTWVEAQASGRIVSSRVEADGIDYNIKGIKFDGLQVRQFETVEQLAGLVELFETFQALARSNKSAGKEKQSPDPKDLEDALKFLAILDIYRVERVGVESIELIAAAPDAPEFSLNLNQLEINGLAGFNVEEAKTENVEVSLAGRRVFQNKSFSMRGLRVPEFRRFLSLVAIEAEAKAKGERFEPNAKQLRELVPTLEQLSLGELTIAPAIGQGPVELRQFDLKMGDHIGPIPTKMSVSIDGFSIPSALLPDPKAQAGLLALGYSELSGDLKIDLAWDEATNTLSANEVSIDAKDVAQIFLSASLGGISRALFEDPEKNVMAATFASIDNLDIKITNNSFFERAIELASRDLQQDPENIKRLIAAQARQFLALLGNEEFSNQVLGELATFLNDPKSLKLTAAPLNPVPVLQLGILAHGSPGLLVQMLNVDVKANK